MKYLKLFNSVQEMYAAMQTTTVSMTCMAYYVQTPIVNVKVVPPPTNLAIACSENVVTITADNASTFQYCFSLPNWVAYTGPFEITETVTVYAKAINDSGSITASQVCEYSGGLTTPFYIEDISGSANTVQIKKNGDSAPTLTIEKSTDGETWESMGSTSTSNITATVPANGKLYLRCSADKWGYSDYYNTINTTGNCKVGGNINSLLYGSSFNGQTEFPNTDGYNFKYLFASNTHLVDASSLLLPATTLANHCYGTMFFGCSSLTTAPALPAITLANYCYNSMFYGCTSLTTAPALPATTLAERCYSGMFYGCTSLTTAPVLPATTLAQSCYSAMFRDCTSLTTAPALPAITLTNYCYQNMFTGCTNLNYIKCLATTISTYYTSNWVSGVASTGTFVKDPNVTSWTTGVSGIPEGWVVKNPSGIELTQDLNVATIEVNDLDTGTGYYTINGGSQVSLAEGVTTVAITNAMNGQTLLAHGEFDGTVKEETLVLSWVDYTPTITISESDNYVTITAPTADTIEYRLGSSGEYSAYTAPVYIAADTTIYVRATRTVSSVDYTATDSQAVTHSVIPPTNLVISCSANMVTITANNAQTLEYNTDGSSTYTTYTEPFAITQTVTVYAKATNVDGSITGSQECVYQAIPFAENLMFYAPLGEGDLTDHISGLSGTTDSGCSVTWNSTYNMYQLTCSGGDYRAALRWVGLSLYDTGHNIRTDGLTVTANIKFISQSGNNYSAFYACDSLKDTFGQYASNHAYLYLCNARFSGGVGSDINRLTTTLSYGGSGNLKFYKNSSLAGSINWGASEISASRAPDTLSLCERHTNNTNMTILISDVRVYNRVLSAAEVAQL